MFATYVLNMAVDIAISVTHSWARAIMRFCKPNTAKYVIKNGFDQWTNGPTDQWTNGPIDQWTNGPKDQRSIE